MSDITFGETVEIPKIAVKRETTPNPFDGKFPSDEAALPVTLTADSEDAALKAVNSLASKARKAAQAVNRTARKSATIEETVTGTGKSKTTTYTVSMLFWTVPQQKRPGSGRNGKTD